MYREISQNRSKRGGVACELDEPAPRFPESPPCALWHGTAAVTPAGFCDGDSAHLLPLEGAGLTVPNLAGGSLGSFPWNPSEEWNCAGMKAANILVPKLVRPKACRKKRVLEKLQ